MKFYLTLLLIISFFCFNQSRVEAFTQPQEVSNNKVGVHVIDENDLDKAAELVNSSGGDWGYVTIVIREDDRNQAKWQNIFDRMRQLHLIPLVRLSTKHQSDYWEKPRPEDFDPWVSFLNSLNWVVQNRYVILWNEPNHAKEWGGEINPEEFAQLSLQLSYKLKQASPDFFILPAGIDLAAPDTAETMSPQSFYQKIFSSYPQYFQNFPGWTSHSYPNPNFSASPYKQGQTSIAGYKWEQQFLSKYGLESNLAIFITETGWAHDQGIAGNSNFPSSNLLGDYYNYAFSQVWSDPQIVAVTPFILKYQSPPFDHFSLLDPISLENLPSFDSIQSLSKTKGTPKQIHSSSLVRGLFPPKIPQETNLMVALTFRNTGQSIWDNTTSLVLTTDLPQDRIIIDQIPYTPPGGLAKIWLSLDTQKLIGSYSINAQLSQNQIPFGSVYQTSIEVTTSKTLISQLRLWFFSLIHRQDIIVYLFSFPSVYSLV